MDLLDLFDQAATQSVLDLKDPDARDWLTLKRDLARLAIPRIRTYAAARPHTPDCGQLASLVAALSSTIALAASIFPDENRGEFLAVAFKGIVEESSHFATIFKAAARKEEML